MTNGIETMVGESFRLGDYYEVGREKIREFARAVQDYHPAHWSEDAAHELGYQGLVAPLTFVSLLGIIAQREMGNRFLRGYDVSQMLQTDQVLEFARPIQAGDRLHCEVSLESFRRAFGGDLISVKNEVRDQVGAPLLTSYTTVVGRSGTRDEAMAEAVDRVLMHGISPGADPRPPTYPGRGPGTPSRSAMCCRRGSSSSRKVTW
jgi:acyl dehydratase